MEFSDEDKIRAHRAAMNGIMAPNGPRLDGLELVSLANAIEAEVERATAKGQRKLSIHMDLADAAEFASKLRRAALLGA